MKLITVVIPSYNVENFLARCLDSLTYDADVLDKLDIVVVNDGSTDKTLSVAKSYKKRFPGTVSVIDKENGGHGSTVNAGLQAAKGKYFKVVDADDWVNIDDFGRFVLALEKIDVDFVVTDYEERHLYDESVRELKFCDNQNHKTNHLIDEAVENLKTPNFFFQFSMHSMAVKTQSLRKVWGDGLLEKTFYVDQQYVAKVLEAAKTYAVLDFDIYRYFIGRPEQSVGMEGFYKHRDDHERVLRWLLDKQKDLADEHANLRKILRRQIELMLGTHYEIYYQKIESEDRVIAEILEFDRFLNEEDPEMHGRISAAQNLKKRLAPWRRKLKQKVLSNRR